MNCLHLLKLFQISLHTDHLYMSQLGDTIYNIILPILRPHGLFQQQQMDGPVRKYEEGAAAVGGGDKDVDGIGSGGAGTGDDVKVVGPYGAALKDQELGSDRGNA